MPATSPRNDTGPTESDLLGELEDLMSASAPEDLQGYCGSLSLALTDAQVEAVGSVETVRSAMRRAGRKLGWRVRTFAYTLGALTYISVSDQRPVPGHLAEAAQRFMDEQMRNAAQMAARRLDPEFQGLLIDGQECTDAERRRARWLKTASSLPPTTSVEAAVRLLRRAAQQPAVDPDKMTRDDRARMRRLRDETGLRVSTRESSIARFLFLAADPTLAPQPQAFAQSAVPTP